MDKQEAKSNFSKLIEKYLRLVNERLFQDMMQWRLLLAKGFHKANSLNPDELDEGVQRVLDRFIFIRTAEDRGIEPNILLALLRQHDSRKSLIKSLSKMFRDFDQGYNSKLFDLHYSEAWDIDDEILNTVINGLYDSEGYRYDFSAISADVLGGIYEQYLEHTRTKLPNLAGKIGVGNSLISGTDEDLHKYFSEGIGQKKPFAYEQQFPEVFSRKNPGFDVIIGTPPYVRIQTLPKDEVRYFSSHYKGAVSNYDIYTLFVERGFQLLREGGILGFILPKKFFTASYGEGLREMLSKIGESELKRLAPKTYEYLRTNERLLKNREQEKFSDNQWYRFGRTQNIGIQGQVKICVPRLVSRIQAIFDENGEFYLDNVDVGGMTLKDATRANYLYVLSLLNSSLLSWYLIKISTSFRGGFYSCNKQYLSQLPIKLLDLSKQSEKARHDEIVSLANKMLRLNKEIQRVSENTDKWHELKREMEQTDKAIDERVFEGYEVTGKEKKIIEVQQGIELAWQEG